MNELLKGIRFITLRTHDLKAARKFYVEDLGFQVIEEKAGEFFQVSIAGTPFCVDLTNEIEKWQPNQIGIDVDDLDSVTVSLIEKGFSPATGENLSNGEVWALIKDPDGHELIFLKAGSRRESMTQ